MISCRINEVKVHKCYHIKSFNPKAITRSRSLIVKLIPDNSNRLLAYLINIASSNLQIGYKVVFLYRKGSVYPFTTGLRSSASKYIDDKLLSNLEDRKQGIFLNVNNGGRIKSELRCYNHCIKNKMLLSIPYETLQEYLTCLQFIAEELSYLKERVCFYLAAAVSDFYVPDDEVCFVSVRTV